MLGGVRLVIYDLDGTLIDSREAIVESFNIVLKEMGEPPQPAGVIESMIGEPFSVILSKILPPDKQNMIQWFWDAYIPVYARIGPEKTSILPGVRETLKALKDRGLMQSIATTKRSDVASRLLGELGLLGYFDIVLGINDVANPKPAPDIIKLTLRRLGFGPEEAVFVEDTTIGLEAGIRAGVRTVGVTTGTHSREKLMAAGPSLVLDRIDGLLSLISS